MCGIHGFVSGSKRNNNGDDFVKQGFVAGSLRGMDSSGIASISGSGAVFQKLPVSGPAFITDRYAQELMRKASEPWRMTICHTRAATAGGISLSNAHPFFIEEEADDGSVRELVGVHNGTLTSWQYKTGGRNYDVDSEWALNRIFDVGIKAFEDFHGAFCFVWWESTEGKKLNFALNDERPMYIAFTTDDGMAFASEAGMLHWLCERNNIKLDGDIRKLEAGHHYKFDLGKLKEFEKVALPKPVYASSSTSTYQSNYNSTSSYKPPATGGDVAKVESLIAELTRSSTVVPIGNGSKVTLRPEEITVAHELQMSNKKGLFEPYELLSDRSIEGIFTFPDESSYTGIIRNADMYEFNANSRWHATVIGAIDDGKEIKLILSKPYGITPKATTKA